MILDIEMVYGWNLQQLESAVRHIIVSSLYQGTVEVEFKTRSSKVYIRPDNKLSRLLSNKWIKFLSIILLIYPFIWLFKRFNSRGGGSWEVCGSAHALKRWVPCPQDEINRTPDHQGSYRLQMVCTKSSECERPSGVDFGLLLSRALSPLDIKLHSRCTILSQISASDLGGGRLTTVSFSTAMYVN